MIDHIHAASHYPGQRFLSNRSVARQFGISYQTADLLIRELTAEGQLERRAASGTYIPGRRATYSGVLLIFHPRAKRKNSFSGKLLDYLIDGLNRERIDWRMVWAEPGKWKKQRIATNRYPVIWEREGIVDQLVANQQHGLLLNERPPAGKAATLIDSISVDDFSGGATAAQFLVARCMKANPRFAVMAGPPSDGRSRSRVDGFLSIVGARVIASPTWFYSDARTLARAVVRAGPDGVFCGNDRLAEAVTRYCTASRVPKPSVVGFDDAPIASWLHLSTIAIPWEELVSSAIAVIQRRMTGYSGLAIAQFVSTRLVVRD